MKTIYCVLGIACALSTPFRGVAQVKPNKDQILY